MRISNIFFRILVVALCMNVSALAQERPTAENAALQSQDTLSLVLGGENKTFVQVDFGAGIYDHVDVAIELFNLLSHNEICLGYSERWLVQDRTPKLRERYGSFAYGESEARSLAPNSENIYSKTATFALGNRKGYGYRLGSVAFIPYHYIELSANALQFAVPEAVPLAEEEAAVLERYPGKMRLGLGYGGGAKLDLSHTFALNLSYETGVVYPRWLFWEWLGSYAIQGAGAGVVDYLGDRLVEATPLFGPILYWGLKNGLSLYYGNRIRKSMNWPFAGEAPLANATVKIGAQLSF